MMAGCLISEGAGNHSGSEIKFRAGWLSGSRRLRVDLRLCCLPTAAGGSESTWAAGMESPMAKQYRGYLERERRLPGEGIDVVHFGEAYLNAYSSLQPYSDKV